MASATDSICVAGESASLAELEALLRQQVAGASHLWVRELLCFAVPHTERGEAVGVAVVCDPAYTTTLHKLRRAAGRGGVLNPRLLPEVMVLLPALPASRTGLAAELELPSLSLTEGLRTLDLRKPQAMTYARIFCGAAT